MVHKYRVSFFKRLADSTGHVVDACQATVEVSAPDKQQAIHMARRRFAEDSRVSKWWLRADYETAAVVDGRPDVPEPDRRLPGLAGAPHGVPH